MESESYRELDRKWRAACRVVLGGEVGSLDDYSEWLSGLNDKLTIRKTPSGQSVVMTSDSYCAGSPVQDMANADFMKKFEPLSINDMKDIDSLLFAVRERATYSGNITIGNSKFVEQSSEVSDSFYVYRSVRISGCKNVAYSQWMRLSEDIYGTNEGGETQFCIRCGIVYRNQRSFELWIGSNTSDSYYSYGLEGCKDCIFCFNLVGKNFAIGNLVLPRDKYKGIKEKLLAELREELKEKRRLPSLIELVSQEKPDYAEAAALTKGLPPSLRDRDKSRLEEAFTSASSVVLGAPLKGIDSYSKWLSRHSIVPRDSKSVLSGTILQVSDYPVMRELPENRIVTQEEANLLGEKLIALKSAPSSLSIADAPSLLSRIAYFPPERRTGTNSNLVACQWGGNSTDCYKLCVASHDKCCGYDAWPRSSEHIFGSGLAFHSEFCFKCFDVVQLRRCFEVDSARGCADTWFSHNVEGLQNALFCFNTKSKRNAVGNAEVGAEQFAKAKKIVQDWVLSELKKKKDVPLSIYDLACRGRE
ncbi:MAG: hypothetical protein WCT52_02465 [Candidatus Micrarchaeia archaeon]